MTKNMLKYTVLCGSGSVVERHLAKVNVASSNLVFRSTSEQVMLVPFFCYVCTKWESSLHGEIFTIGVLNASENGFLKHLRSLLPNLLGFPQQQLHNILLNHSKEFHHADICSIQYCQHYMKDNF